MTTEHTHHLLLAALAPLETQGGNPTKAQCRRVLTALRMNTRNVISALVESCDEEHRLSRYEKQLKDQGITSLPVAFARKQAKRRHQSAREALSASGEQIMYFLDLWKEKGATPLDLCYLCGHEHRRTLRELEGREKGWPFSKLIFVCNLDFRNDKADSLEYETDAPFTHAVKEYMLDLMLNTEHGRVASREAFVHCFPEVWDKRLTLTRDSEGEEVFVDKDGGIVGYPKEGLQ